jgi:hypothetical protein
MKYFNFIKKIKKYSLLAAILPMLTIAACLFLFSNLAKITLYPNYINWDQDKTLISWVVYKDKNKNANTSADSITNCPAFQYLKDFTLKDGTKFGRIDEKYQDQTLTNKDIKYLENTYGKKNILGVIYTQTDVIESKCIKNYPIKYKILKIFPSLEKVLIKSLKKNNLAFQEIKNPFLYGEVSISRTARYYPATFIFKPLIILSALFLFIYWRSTFKVFKLMNLNYNKLNKKFLIFGILSCFLLTAHAAFLGVDIDNNLFKLLRRAIVILFIFCEVAAQILLTRSLYIARDSLEKFIKLSFLKAKIIFVIIISLVTIVSFIYLTQFDHQSRFVNALEWNYFFYLLFYYVLSHLMWKKV